ncbi:MAG: RNA polymerase sigma factor [Candidatus Marinimicrobia bacterium]|nr:RNA polymerase sigma factor [Candidatus Neomarinimicrobiota bacterium]
MAAITDQEIVQRFRSGDRELAFQQLVEAHGKNVYNIALFTLNDDILAEDATQDAFIKIYRGLGKFRGQAKLSSWVYRIVKNVCYDYLKKRHPAPLEDEQAYPLIDGAGSGPEETFFASEKHRAVRHAVDQLPRQQKMAVTLYYFHQRSYEEVAEIMEQPLGTIKSHIHRAKAILTTALGRYEGSPA